MKVPLSLIITRMYAYERDFGMIVTKNGKVSVSDVPDVKMYRRTGRGILMKPVGRSADRYEVVTSNNPADYNEARGKCPVGYYHRFFIDNETLILANANTKPLKTMYFDIEVLTKGDRGFPHAENNPVMLIGYAIDNNPVQVIQCYNREKKYPDVGLLEEFFHVVEKEDPDVMSGYNSAGFDMPYIMYRSRKSGVDYRPLSRIWTQGRNMDEFEGEQSVNMIVTELLEQMLPKHMREKEVARKRRDNSAVDEGTGVDNKRRGVREVFDFGGRIHYDIYNVDVVRDQLLTGLPDKTLKTMARHYGVENPEELGKDIMHNLLAFAKKPGGYDKLIKYIISDVECTREVHSRYFDTTMAIADDLSIPLSHSVSRSNGLPAGMLILKGIEKVHMIVVDTNLDRYPQLYERFYKYRGAEVDINPNKKGRRLTDLKKFDYSSQYPSAMMTWNLGPDTVRLLSTDTAVPERLITETVRRRIKGEVIEREVLMDTYQDKGVPEELWEEHAPKEEFNYSAAEKVLYMKLPDRLMNVIFELRVDMSKDSFVREQLKELTTRKSSIGRKIKATPDTPENASLIKELKSRRNSVKVQSNSVYGILANQHGIGDLPLAAAVTSLCRYTINKLVDYVGDDLVEIDTDGIICVGNHTLEDMMKVSRKAVQSTFVSKNEHELGMTPIPEAAKESRIEDHMVIDVEEFDRGFFYLEKNYCLKEKDSNNYIIHGATLKSSSMTGIQKKVRDLLVAYYLADVGTTEEIINYAQNKNNFELKDFVKRVSPSKEYDQYKSGKKNLVYRLLSQALARGVEYSKGDVIEYIRIKRGVDAHSDITANIDDEGVKSRVLVITGELADRSENLLELVDFDSYMGNEVKTMFETFSVDFDPTKKKKGVLTW